ARAQLAKAKTATWQITYHGHFVSPDGQQHRWVRAVGQNQKQAYKSPGLYRTESRDEKGGLQFLSIQDAVNRAKLDVHPARRVATLSYLAEAEQSPGGPFILVLRMMQRSDLQPLGEADVAGRKARGFRQSFWTPTHNQKWSYEFWLDTATGKLLRY